MFILRLHIEILPKFVTFCWEWLCWAQSFHFSFWVWKGWLRLGFSLFCMIMELGFGFVGNEAQGFMLFTDDFFFFFWGAVVEEEGLLIWGTTEKEQEGVVVVGVALERIKLTLLVGFCKHYFTLWSFLFFITISLFFSL